jgi:DNA-binding transcriptional MerR regulator
MVLPDKLFFRIGEVADIVGVRPHVLRYWEEELGILRPMKTRGAHRQYRRRDVEIALVIKKLLHEEGFTVAGARKRLREMGHLKAAGRESDAPPAEARAVADAKAARSRELEYRGELLALRAELSAMVARLDAAMRDTVPGMVPAPAREVPAMLVVRVEAGLRER